MSHNEQLDKETMQWAIDSISSNGLTLIKNEPELVQNTPWSYVARFMTADGYIYLKKTPKAIAIEALIIKILKDNFNVPVAHVISENNELCCFLMKDAGIKLLDAMNRKFDVSIICDAVNTFAEMQVSVAEKPNELMDAGVPDWRIERFSELFIQIISQHDLLLEDGLAESEFKRLDQLTPWIQDLANELIEYNISQTLVQPDFNVNNILIGEHTGDFTIIDLGEIVISHPFFSIINFLQQIRKYNLAGWDDSVCQVVRDCYLMRYHNAGLKPEIMRALSLTKLLFPVYWVFAQYRLIMACGVDKVMASQRGKLSEAFRFCLSYKSNHLNQSN